MTTPAEYAGSDLVRLHTAVMRDRPAEMTAQADAWDSLATLLRSHGTALTGHTERLGTAWTGATATEYREYVSRRTTGLSEAADLAARNGTAWRAIATTARRAQTELAAIHADWDREGRPEGEARRAFDDRAREAMTAIAAETDFHKSGFENHGRYAELAPTGFIQQDRPEGHLEGREPGGSVKGVPATAIGDGVSASRSAESSPQLQAVATPSPTPAPGPAPVAPPAQGPGIAPPPYAPTTPPPRATAPPQPSTRPGSSPPRPPAARPVPRPPQTTVKPVLGGRPGGTGTASTAGTRTPKPLARPVIGARAGSQPKAPKGTLIGKDGVVRSSAAKSAPGPARNITRMPPKAGSGSGNLNRAVIRSAKPAANPGSVHADGKRTGKRRDEGRAIKSDGPLDDFWTEPATVPGVITSRPAPAVDPGPVVALSRGDHTESEPVEHDTLRRLAAVDEETSTKPAEDWTLPAAGRGIVTPRKLIRRSSPPEGSR